MARIENLNLSPSLRSPRNGSRSRSAQPAAGQCRAGARTGPPRYVRAPRPVAPARPRWREYRGASTTGSRAAPPRRGRRGSAPPALSAWRRTPRASRRPRHRGNGAAPAARAAH